MRAMKSAIIGLAIFFTWASVAYAEPFVDLWLGGAFTQDHDVEDVSSLPATLKIKDAEFDNSFTGGGQVGYWFGATPGVGFALEVFHYQPDFDRQTRSFSVDGSSGIALFEPIDLNVTVVGFNFMGRYGLAVSPQFPNGQFQPYLSVGPGIFITRVKDKGNFFPPGQSETDTSAGVIVKTGLKFFFTRNWAVFGEYRLTSHSPSVKLRDDIFPPTSEKLSTRLNTHYVGAGVSFHF